MLGEVGVGLSTLGVPAFGSIVGVVIGVRLGELVNELLLSGVEKAGSWGSGAGTGVVAGSGGVKVEPVELSGFVGLAGVDGSADGSASGVREAGGSGK